MKNRINSAQLLSNALLGHVPAQYFTCAIFRLYVQVEFALENADFQQEGILRRVGVWTLEAVGALSGLSFQAQHTVGIEDSHQNEGRKIGRGAR